MTPCHQRPFTIGTEHSDAGHLALVASSLPDHRTDRVLLPMGGSHFQGFSNRCAAHAVVNVLETLDAEGKLEEDIPDAIEIYELAREKADQDVWDKGTFLEAAAEAVCDLMGGTLKWMFLPADDPNTLANWITVERTGIALGSMWTSGHLRPTWRTNVCVPNHETRAPGHAVALNGFVREYAFRPAFWKRRVTKPVFSFENTHRFSDQRFFLEPGAIRAYAHTAIVFTPT